MAYTACVTGATGFIATELIKQLLEKGYNVKATVRNALDAPHCTLITNLAAALPGNLQLLQADITKHGSLDDAVEGCDFLFHVASPFFIDSKDPQAELVDPAVEGARNAIQTAAKYKPRLKRVILTSSVAAVHGMLATVPPLSGEKYTEQDWNSESTVETQAYWAGKTQAERRAWSLAKELGVDLVTILPEFVMGPVLSQHSLGTSVKFFKAFLEGPAHEGHWTFSDVRDVARAHVLAAETANAKGRYIVAHPHPLSSHDVTDILQKRFPDHQLPSGKEDPCKSNVDSSKVQQELRLSISDPRSTIVDMATTMIQLGIAAPTKAAAPV